MALDLTKPLRTKEDHRKAVFLEVDGLTRIAVKEPEGWVVLAYSFPADIVENVPETRELDCWVNVHDDSLSIFYTKERADTLGSGGRIACLHIQRTYEVGEGLS